MKPLFGTDGIRGVANRYPMTPDMAVKIGNAVAAVCGNKHQSNLIIIGQDTRQSGDMLVTALTAGICSAGVDTYLAGILPTPGVAYMVSDTDAIAGIAVTASHNPSKDNGIKVFDQNGYKISRQIEIEVEKFIHDEGLHNSLTIGTSNNLNKESAEIYQTFLANSLPTDGFLKDMRIVIDCANGATSYIAPSLFTQTGVSVKTLHANPNGKNINLKCGSEHPDILQRELLKEQAVAGFAFDGDGDRVVAVDETGNILTGDQLLAIFANFFKTRAQLKNNLVVSTVMSNVGLNQALKSMKIAHLMVDVGDRNVMESMKLRDAIIGGEDSGHMIFLNQHTTGDGLLSALNLLRIMQETGESLSKLATVMTVYPQILMNVAVGQKPDLSSLPDVQAAIREIETLLADKGRVLVRYSGTQPLCRVMVEAPTAADAEQYCKQLTVIIDKNIGK